jgi:hypothetical protein
VPSGVGIFFIGPLAFVFGFSIGRSSRCRPSSWQSAWQCGCLAGFCYRRVLWLPQS